MRGKQKDTNQSELVEVFNRFGFECIDISQLASAGFDFLVIGRGHIGIVEAKNGALPPSKRQLTQNEQKRKEQCERHGVAYNVIENIEQAVSLARAMR
jgi:hypothetical protein